MKPDRWSYSSISTYQECPAKWKYLYVDKLPTIPSAAMERGTKMHTACETYLNGGQMDDSVKSIKNILYWLLCHYAFSESVWKLDANWTPNGKTWIKAIVDAHFVKDDTLNVFDFKSGKKYLTHNKQLELYSIIGYKIYPNVKRIRYGAIYIDNPKLSWSKNFSLEMIEPARINWHNKAVVMMMDNLYIAKPGEGCYFCNYKDSIGGPCNEWRGRKKNT